MVHFCLALLLISPILHIQCFNHPLTSTVQKEPLSLASMDIDPPSRRTELIAVQVSMPAVALLIVALRLISRYMIPKSPGWDDCAITVAMILAIVQAPLVLSCLKHGGGAHYSDIQPKDALYVMKVIYATRVIYLLIVTAIKCSMLSFYLRLSPCTTFHRLVKATMVACGIEGVLFISMALFQCTPVQSFWNSAVPGHCINILAFFRAETAFNLVTNVAILLLPMPVVWCLHTALRRRILLTCIFASGVIPCGSLIARLVNINNSEEALIAGEYDPTWIVVSLQNCEAVEYCTALICASLIHLKPIIKIVATSIFGSIHPISPRRGITEYRTPAYLLNARASPRYDAIGTGRHAFSVISAFELLKGITPKVRFRAGMDVGTDAPGRESYEGLLQRPQKALLRGWKSR